MALLFSNEIRESVEKELKRAISSVQIITAYCKESSLRNLTSVINPLVTEKRLLVRFRMDDIIKGSTDFNILEFGLKNGWEVYIRFDLHAKTYIVDNKRGVVGSANLTNSGLGIGRTGNMEIATLIDVKGSDIEKINRLFNDAISVDWHLLDRLREQVDMADTEPSGEPYGWDASITALFNPHIDTLFSHELPTEFSMIEGEYFAFLDETYYGNRRKLKESFRWSNVYLWLLTTLKENSGCLYFGETVVKLHNVLVTDPKPYRRDVKKMLANLLRLIEELDMEDIVVDRPNYSQRLRLRSII